MSRAFKCDRCGKLFDYDDGHPATQQIIVYNLGSCCDLCGDCDGELKNWFENKEEKDETKS